ncbi:hypothetical protein JOB18_000301 [Solea senegalensis]|uniref:PH domain-containing protein n=1 Tax=Solea senegalensis TaxID=28829 RepID=A0AAV6RYY5_SOLSE|nr:hypothetical protein JOB18_000301 [Solea senegalensis]
MRWTTSSSAHKNHLANTHLWEEENDLGLFVARKRNSRVTLYTTDRDRCDTCAWISDLTKTLITAHLAL